MSNKIFGSTPRITSTKKFTLPNTGRRFIHIASMTWGVRDYLVIADRRTGKYYVEEITGGHLKQIEDDAIHTELVRLLDNNGLTTVIEKGTTLNLPTLKP